eukprot:CAMPEP_0195626190 /NCGR_PEP_ID=MMETSP0815-20121206/18254_1 /TAXON_ID=97485 /ORGANISM="Prymnesium parvum, Strain Texoma1" /LENGTH=271 /DNA_ID=CAMNT_0040767317 /DNA_START=22 /DNA_END=838 /DNA_ORIENTATION=-
MLAPDTSVDLSLVASLIFVGACTVALRRLTAIEHALKLREPPANCSYRIESSSKVSRSTSTEMKTCCGPTPPALQVPDIIHRITEYLDRRSLSIFARCNKACHAVATSDDVWGALMQRELKVSRFPVAPRLQPTQLVAGSCRSDARLPAKLLCRRATEALMANEQFYEFIRSRDLCAMSSLWLREELDLSQIEEGGDMLQDIFRRYPSMLHHQADGRKCIAHTAHTSVADKLALASTASGRAGTKSSQEAWSSYGPNFFQAAYQHVATLFS